MSSFLHRNIRFELPEAIPGGPAAINLSHGGWLIFVTDRAWVAEQDFSAWRAFDRGAATGDVVVQIAVAQQAGFWPGCNARRGVQVLRWLDLASGRMVRYFNQRSSALRSASIRIGLVR